MLKLFIGLLLTIHIIVSFLIILVVLMQRPKSEGLGAAFGGGMTDQFFGAQTTNVLAKFTRILGGIFFVLTLTLSILYARQSTNRSVATDDLLRKAPAVVVPPVTGTTGTTAATGAATLPEVIDMSGTGSNAGAVSVPETSGTAETPAPAASPSAAANPKSSASPSPKGTPKVKPGGSH